VEEFTKGNAGRQEQRFVSSLLHGLHDGIIISKILQPVVTEMTSLAVFTPKENC